MLVAFETLHHMQTKKSGKHGYMAMKLDMSKAYDRVECNFLIKIMERMGFHKKWVGWIYECVSTISFSIMVNGEPRGHIVPSRGLRQLRQGDPLSPYFFLLCSKGLNGLINNAMHEGKIQGYSLCRTGPKISHLFFADDSLLFCRASLGDVTTIQNILEVYETASRQQINKEKTTLFFGKSVSKEVKNSVKELLGVLGIKRYEKYLGLPAIVGKNRSASLNYIKDRVWSKLQGWKEKLLSQAGKEVLLKAVVQTIPTFAWDVSSFQWSYVGILRCLSRNFGGDNGKIEGKFTGKIGKHFVNQRKNEGWVLRS